MKKKTWGVVLLVLGVMAILGSVVNGSAAEYANGVDLSEFTSILLEIAMVVGGIILIMKGKNGHSNCDTETNNAPIYMQQQSVPDSTAIASEQYKMKWFKFLIYFALFAGAFVNLAYGFSYISGGIYFSQTNGQVTADMVYSTYGAGLKVLDVIQGILMIVVAVFGVYTRMRLARYKINAPLCVYILYGTNAGLTLFYNIALLAVTGLNQLTSVNSITTIAVSIGCVLLNRVYFTKRKSLFVN